MWELGSQLNDLLKNYMEPKNDLRLVAIILAPSDCDKNLFLALLIVKSSMNSISMR